MVALLTTCMAYSLAQGGLYSGPYAKEAVRRYEQVWLPILTTCSAELIAQIVPPLDVAYVWLVRKFLAMLKTTSTILLSTLLSNVRCIA